MGEKIDITNQLRKATIHRKIEDTFNGVKNFCIENKEWVLGVGIPLAIGAIGGAIKSANRRADVKETQRLKDNYIWDPKHGIYFETRRKMTNSERTEYARRRDEGEGVESILKSMRILK